MTAESLESGLETSTSEFRLLLVPVHLNAPDSSIPLGQGDVLWIDTLYLFTVQTTEPFPNILSTVISVCLHFENPGLLLRRL